MPGAEKKKLTAETYVEEGLLEVEGVSAPFDASEAENKEYGQSG